MNTRIILLRGVMPVGKNKVPMGQLREVLTKAGFKNVRTYRAVLINNVACFKVIRTAVHKNLRLACDKTFEKRSIASGNVLVDSTLPEAAIAKCVRDLIATHIGPEILVLVRTAAEIQAALNNNPFPKGAPNHVLIYFFAKPVAGDFLKDVVAPGGEEVVVSGREVYVHYPVDIGHSKLKLPKEAQQATARNINTLAKLMEMSTKHG